MPEFFKNLISDFPLDQFLNNLIMLGRILLAAFCGFIIGMERKKRGKGAGVRTHIIVALGSALMMVISKYGFFDIVSGNEKYDGARIAAQIVSGIGFLGAGMIFVKGNAIQGLTTAAGVWTTAGIGMAIGAGMYFVGITTSLAMFFIQLLLHKNWRFLHRENEQNLEIVLLNDPKSIENFENMMKELDLPILQTSYKRIPNERILLTVVTSFPDNFDQLQFLKHQNELIESITV